MNGYGILSERGIALADLLDRVLVTRRSSPEAYRRIFLHYPSLQEWFRERTGWRLTRWEDAFRLERVPPRAFAGRGLEGLREPLDYACFSWILWFAATRAGEVQDWFALSDLAREVQEVSGGRFTLEMRSHRESFVRSLRLFQLLGVLAPYAGSEEYWVSRGDQADAHAEVLYDLAPHAPRLLAAVGEEVLQNIGRANSGQKVPPSLSGEARPLARAWRALLLGPALWRGDDPEAFAALVKQAREVEDDLYDSLGWHLEVGRDHARVWRSATGPGAGGLLVDLGGGPGEEGTPHVRYSLHPVLLLAGRIREDVADGRYTADAEGAVRVTEGDLRDHLLGLAKAHRGQWGQEMQKMGLEQLFGQVFRLMRRLGFLRGPDADGTCWVLPGAAGAIGFYDEQREELY
ncbi:MAG: TIGR02678 family protein [Peptococcaceae bacterium]|nr:TIGR02678 family protein [Peptococcaceae bacterium]